VGHGVLRLALPMAEEVKTIKIQAAPRSMCPLPDR
jgi:hypothetical protein